MNGWQRFGLLVLCCFTIMVLYPDFNTAGWTFIGLAMAMWTGVIMVLAVISNLFGLYKLETFNKLITFVLLCGIMYSLLWYFPQEDNVSPINKIKYGEIPTKEDIQKGLKRMTFNFDFVRRNARRKENFINQDLDGDKVKKEIKKKVSKTTNDFIDSIDIEVE